MIRVLSWHLSFSQLISCRTAIELPSNLAKNQSGGSDIIYIYIYIYPYHIYHHSDILIVLNLFHHHFFSGSCHTSVFSHVSGVISIGGSGSYPEHLGELENAACKICFGHLASEHSRRVRSRWTGFLKMCWT